MCWLGFHKYGKWSVVQGGKSKCMGATYGFWTLQQRTCSECGYVKIKVTETN